MKRIFFLFILATSCFFLTRATDYYVSINTGSNSTGTGTIGNPWKTINYAIIQATLGDTIRVMAGIYNSTWETLPIQMKDGVSLIGEGSDSTIIDGSDTYQLITCTGFSNTVIIEGFKLTGGYAWSDGTAIDIYDASVIIRNNEIVNCRSGSYDGTIVVSPAWSDYTVIIENNIIKDNTAGMTNYDGAAIEIDMSWSTGGVTIVRNNLIANIDGNFQDGTAISVQVDNPVEIYNNTITGVRHGFYLANGVNVTIRNNIIANCSRYGIFESDINSDPTVVHYNLFYNNTLGHYYNENSTAFTDVTVMNEALAGICLGNIEGDPLFVDTVSDDYHLQSSSPAIDAGDPDPQFNDPDGSRNDIGAFTFDKPPAIPQNLSATAGGEKLTLRWNPNTESDLDQYSIYRDLSSPATTLVDSVISTSPPDTFYVDTGLIAGQNYYYRITAKDTAGNESDFSDEVMETPITGLQQDSLALVALYDSTDGANWTDNTNWLTGNVSTWYGIIVSGNRVAEILLDSNNLIGTIPPEIGNLTSLQILKLDHNQLSGSIPPEIGNLTNLTELTLWANQLTDIIPSEIGNLTSLTILDLDVNQLSGEIPFEIGNLVNLEEFWSCQNQLSGSIPSSIGNLTNLTVLSIWENQFTGIIPTEIGNLTNLTELSLSYNQLTGSVPTEIGNLINLSRLLLTSNQLSGAIPSEIGNLDSLKTLALGGNQLSGFIPAELQNLNKLTKLYLWGNQLTGSIPPEIGNLVNLINLQLSSNLLTGTIPPEFGNLVNLEVLYLWGNQLTGAIPIEIGNLSDLTNLSLLDNQLSGSIPTEIGNLTSLQVLYLNDNQFTDLPDLSLLVLLDDLRIQNNQFTFKDIESNIGIANTTFTYSPQDSVGEIIDTTVYVGASYTLSVSTGGASSRYQWKKDGTNIGVISADSTYTINPVAFSDTGAYACEITNTVATDLTLFSRPVNVSVEYPPIYQDSLALVALYDSTDGANWTNNTNWLTGNVSTWFGITVSGDRVTQISLNDNNLTGTIPTEIGNLTNLTDLYLSNNQLSGSIPLEIGNLTSLNRLELQENQLTGVIPTEIGNLTSLYAVYLYLNQLSGSIPSELGNLTNLLFLSFGQNQLTGSIPTEIGNLTNLESLDFSNNQLSGSIPAEIGNLTNLENLRLSYNQLSGSIPTEIGNLLKLYILELGGNQLTGSIPSEIGNLISLTNLYLYNNQFTDLPDLSSLVSLNDLQIQNNQFTFKDIEPNIGLASTTYKYSPQDSIGEIIDTTLYIGTNSTLVVTTGGANNQYQWKKDGINIGTISGDSTYLISPVVSSDSGTYTCEITNTIATDLTLYSRTIHVSVDALHVSTTGDDSNPGTAAEPLRNIQTAMSMAVTAALIKVAVGTYTEGLISQKPVRLYGGYGEDFSETGRSTFFNKTIILGVSTVLFTDNHGCIINGFAFDGNNVAEKGLDLRAGSIAEFNTIYNVKQSSGTAVDITGAAKVINNTLYNNGMGIEISNTGVVVKNNIIMNHNFGINNLENTELANYNCLYANTFNYLGFYDIPGIGDIALNPELVDPGNGDFRLQSTSPCIDAGDPDVKYNDPNGSRNDMGAFPYVTASSENDILSFGFVEQTGGATINNTNHTISIEVVYDADLAGLMATFTLSPGASATINSVDQESGVTTNDFTNPVTYTIKAENGTTQDWMVTVTVESVPSSENDILTYSFAEQTGAATIDDINHTVDIEVVYGTNVTGLVATFTISDLANITVNTTSQVSGVTSNDFTNPVTYTITAEDATSQDWVVTVTIAAAAIITDFPYVEGFESGNGGWHAGGTNSSWQLGNPAGTTINSVTSGTVAWVTNLAGDYNTDEISYVTSPRFDLSGINYPKIEFYIWWDAEGFYDGANFQFKQGTGVWKTLGTYEGENNWYNSSYIYSIEKGFGFDLNNSAGWSGDGEWGYGSNGWVPVSHALTGINNQSDVTFRIAFASNSSYQNDGIAFDDINIYNDPTGIDATKVLLSDIQIYPNPNEGQFVLTGNFPVEESLILQVNNLHGQVVFEKQIPVSGIFREELDLSFLAKGIYYMRLSTGDDVGVRKLIIQ